MAVCGKCGTTDAEIESAEGGMCGKCGADSWIEWADFMIDKEMTHNYVEARAREMGLSLSEVAWRAFESSYTSLRSDTFLRSNTSLRIKEKSQRRAIHQIFKDFIL